MRFGFLALAGALAGCATGQVEVNGVEPYKVKEAVHCQVVAALKDAAAIHPALADYAASYVITLRVERRSSGGVSSLDWVVPHNGDALRLGAGFSLEDRKFESTVLKGRVFPGAEPAAFCKQQAAGLAAFRGDLGIGEWLRSAVSPHLRPNDFGRTIEFGVEYDANLRPGFVITNFAGSAGFNGSRSTENTLDLVFYDATPSGPLRVYVVNQTAAASGEADRAAPLGPGAAAPVRRPPRAPAAEPSTAGERMLDYLIMQRSNDSLR